jgi:hypothetical protein
MIFCIETGFFKSARAMSLITTYTYVGADYNPKVCALSYCYAELNFLIAKLNKNLAFE